MRSISHSTGRPYDDFGNIPQAYKKAPHRLAGLFEGRDRAFRGGVVAPKKDLLSRQTLRHSPRAVKEESL
jgi:hypothetical protein